MTDFARAALAGTARITAPATSGTEVDAFADRLAAEPAEKRLLLLAGAFAVYRRAGLVLPIETDRPTPCAAESLVECSPGAADLVATLLDDDFGALAPEALRALAKAGQRLPFVLLPRLLELRAPALRELVRPVLGERGRWLAALREDWSWATQAAGEAPLPEDADRLWEEGARDARAELLAHARRVDPSRAREWLRATWKSEKADDRAAFLRTFFAGLAPGDEPFLEQAAADRSGQVRDVAFALLAKLPESALSRRVWARAEAWVAGSSGNAWHVELPTAFDPAWARDGIDPDPPERLGPRAHWFLQHFAAVDPAHWETLRHAAPEALVKAALASEHAPMLIEGLMRAVIRHASAAWAPMVWDAWRAVDPELRWATFGKSVFEAMRPEAREARVASLLRDRGEVVAGSLVASVPEPWSPELADVVVRRMREWLTEPHDDPALHRARLDILAVAATRLPRETFAAALAPWPPPASKAWATPSAQRALARFQDTLLFRQRIHEEIPT